MKKENFLIFGIIILAAASSYYFFFRDSKKAGKSKGEKLARIIERRNNVRHREAGQLKWDDLETDIDIYENEMIFTQLRSEAKVEYLNKSVLDIPENTIIKFIKSTENINIDLEKGFFQLDVSNNKEKVILGLGKKVLTIAPTLTVLKFHRTEEKKVVISVVKGKALIQSSGEKFEMRRGDRLELKKKIKKPVFIPAVLSPEYPDDNEEFIVKTEKAIEFKWYSRKDLGKYRLLVAKDAAFSFMVVQKEVTGVKAKLRGFKNNTYYWRVEAEDGGKIVKSAISRFHTISEEAPTLKFPESKKTIIVKPPETAATIKLQWQHINVNNYEISLSEENSDEKLFKSKETFLALKKLPPWQI